MDSEADKLAKCMAELAVSNNVNGKLGIEIMHVRQVNEMLKRELRDLKKYTRFLSRENETLKFKLSQLNMQLNNKTDTGAGANNSVVNSSVNATQPLNNKWSYEDDEGLSDDEDINEGNYDTNSDRDNFDDMVDSISDMAL